MNTKPESSNLLSDMAYEAMRSAINRSDLKPGDRLSEYKLAEWLKISRTPVREALRRLENEGLVSSHPKRGLIVSSLDEASLQELFAARELIEGTVAAMAARFATDSEISLLQHMVSIEPGLIDHPDRMFEHNLTFHRLISQAARNRYLVKYLQSISDTLSANRRVSTLVNPQRRQQVCQEHRQLVDAVARHDEEAARQAAIEHIQGARRARIEVHRSLDPEQA